MNSHEVFIHIHQGCVAGTGAIVRLPQCQWSKPDGYGKISQCITTTKHSKAKTVCIFLGIYCKMPVGYAWQSVSVSPFLAQRYTLINIYQLFYEHWNWYAKLNKNIMPGVGFACLIRIHKCSQIWIWVQWSWYYFITNGSEIPWNSYHEVAVKPYTFLKAWRFDCKMMFPSHQEVRSSCSVHA